MTDAELLACASAFTLKHYDPHTPRGTLRHLMVEQRHTDPEAWAIIGDGNCLNHDGEWEYEMQPSSRDEAFFARCRWSSAREAIDFALEHMRQYPTGYKPDE